MSDVRGKEPAKLVGVQSAVWCPRITSDPTNRSCTRPVCVQRVGHCEQLEGVPPSPLNNPAGRIATPLRTAVVKNDGPRQKLIEAIQNAVATTDLALSLADSDTDSHLAAMARTQLQTAREMLVKARNYALGKGSGTFQLDLPQK